MKNKHVILNKECHFPKPLWGIFRIHNARKNKHPKGYEKEPRTLRAAFSGMTTLLNSANPSPALRESSSSRGEGNERSSFTARSGFTLIELLVVVLIISILAAVALPQYQVAVKKSQTLALIALMKELAQAEELYFLEHGKYTSTLTDLDLSLTYSPISYGNNGRWKMGPHAFVELPNSTNVVISGGTGSGVQIDSYLKMMPTVSAKRETGKFYCRAKVDDTVSNQVCTSLGTGKIDVSGCAAVKSATATRAYSCNVYELF